MSLNLTSLTDLAEHIMLSHSLKLYVGDTTTAADVSSDDDRFVSMNNLTVNVVHPSERIDHGLTHTYGFASPDVELTFTMRLTEELLTAIETVSKRDADGDMPIYNYAITAKSVGGVTSKVTLKAYMPSISVTKPDTQGAAVDMTCTLLAVGGAIDLTAA